MSLKHIKEIDTANFIIEIKNRRAIWDTYNKRQYKRSDVVQQWLEVSKMFNMSVEIAKLKWKGLRDTFRVELKTRGVSSNWAYYKNLYFLKDVLRSRKRKCSIEQSGEDRRKVIPKPEFIDTEAILSDVESENEVIDEIYIPEIDETPQDTSNTLRENGDLNFVDTNEKTDDDLLFFKSMIPFVKRLPDKKKLLFRVKVQQMLYEMSNSC